MKEDIKLARWLNDEMDERELKEFMSSPEFDTYRKIKEYSAQLSAPEADMDTLYSKIERKRAAKSRVLKFTPWLARIAAVLVLALGATYFFYTSHTTQQIADSGERTEFLLPDNSSVVLNAGSEAEYRPWNWQGNRKIELKGEAYFKVAKGETFDVVTKMGKVTVVGTQFNVKARDNRFDVTCYEGSVKVSSNGKEIILTQGKSVAFKDGAVIEAPQNESLQPGWITYETEFYKESLQNIISEMERQYNVDISIPLSIDKDGFTGTIPMNDLDTALETIKDIYHLKSEKAGTKIILSLE